MWNQGVGKRLEQSTSPKSQEGRENKEQQSNNPEYNPNDRSED